MPLVLIGVSNRGNELDRTLELNTSIPVRRYLISTAAEVGYVYINQQLHRYG